MSDLPITSYGRTVAGEKSTAIAVILNILLPGLGTIYAGNTNNGGITLMIDIVLTVLGTYGLIMTPTSTIPDVILFYFSLFCLYCVGYCILLIYSIVICSKACTENNMLWEQYLKNN